MTDRLTVNWGMMGIEEIFKEPFGATWKRVDLHLHTPGVSIVEEAARFLRIHLTERHEIRGFEPEVECEIPEVALREALVNALAHRDYTVPAPVRLFVFDNRVEIRTPGQLPNTVTIEAMRLGGAHVVRNPTIYTLFARLGLVTGIGSGVYRMIQVVREAIGRDPELVSSPSEFVVVLPRRERGAG